MLTVPLVVKVPPNEAAVALLEVPEILAVPEPTSIVLLPVKTTPLVVALELPPLTVNAPPLVRMVLSEKVTAPLPPPCAADTFRPRAPVVDVMLTPLLNVID